jgi:hypothetical protein
MERAEEFIPLVLSFVQSTLWSEPKLFARAESA